MYKLRSEDPLARPVYRPIGYERLEPWSMHACCVWFLCAPFHFGFDIVAPPPSVWFAAVCFNIFPAAGFESAFFFFCIDVVRVCACVCVFRLSTMLVNYA